MAATTSSSITGYGASKNLQFNGEESQYEVWEIKFFSYLRLQKLHKYLLDGDSLRTSALPAPAGADTNAIAAAAALDEEKNEEIFAMLVQVLDDKSINLILRDAKNNGRAAIRILREHFIGSTKPRIIYMWCELTSLKLSPTEDITEYVQRAKKCTSRLWEAKQTIEESMLIAMVVNGPFTLTCYR